MHICPYGAMAIFILNKISQLVPKAQNRVGSPYRNIFCSKLREKASRYTIPSPIRLG